MVECALVVPVHISECIVYRVEDGGCPYCMVPLFPLYMGSCRSHLVLEVVLLQYPYCTWTLKWTVHGSSSEPPVQYGTTAGQLGLPWYGDLGATRCISCTYILCMCTVVDSVRGRVVYVQL